MAESSSPKDIPPDTRVRIRMYRQGLGDCFLLTFFPAGRQPVNALIDCGVFPGTKEGPKKIRNVAQNIAAQTNNTLDLLVATHEHWDHLSGFYDARDVFDPMHIENTWVAWTEDPGQPLAIERKKKKKARLKALQLALASLDRSANDKDRQRSNEIREVVNFFGPQSPGDLSLAFSAKTEEAMNLVTKRQPVPRYCNPGECVEPEWLPGVRFYVLGPPKDLAQLQRSTPTKDEDEVYALGWNYAGIDAEAAFYTAVQETLREDRLPVNTEDQERRFRSFPFDENFQLDQKQYAVTPEDQEHPPSYADFFSEYYKTENDWRKIDTDWLSAAADLALQLDNDTNNTSLALAIELIDSGKVLLFPGDAQVGNWLSWQNLSWTVKTNQGGDQSVRMRDLLARTILYKVGHHASHNATLKRYGLELMQSPDLVAAIPVDEEFARNKKPKPWDMPAGTLYRRLQEKAKGRVLRADRRWPSSEEPRPEGITPGEWKAFKESVKLDASDLFIDYFVK